MRRVMGLGLPSCNLVMRPGPPVVPSARGVLQVSPLAGLGDYRGGELWDLLGEGDRLELIREPRNRLDTNAVRVCWRGNLIGYLPHGESASVARLLDARRRVGAWIARLGRAAGAQLRVDVAMELEG